MNAIVVVDKNWGIGKNNDLLFKLTKDMAFFKEKTMGKVVVMGGNTLLSLPHGNPLKGRTNIVISDVFKRDDVIMAETMPELLGILQNYNTEDLFVMGGAMLYRTLLPYCDTVYATKVDADGGAQVFYENLDKLDNWSCVYESEPIQDGEYTIRFTTYKNSKVKPFTEI